MAKVIIVGGFERKGSYCPQCRKRVPSGNRLENGIKCPRCGFIRWEDFKKYPSFIDIPEPTEADLVTVDKMISDKEEELRTRGGASEKPVVKRVLKAKKSLAELEYNDEAKTGNRR